jgi:hypothetical protein
MGAAGNYPLLKVKAANCRVVISWVAGLTLENSLQHPSVYNETKAVCCWAVNEFHHCMEHSDRYFSDEYRKRVLLALECFLISYSALARMSIDLSRNRWRIVPKMHYMCHTLLDIRATNRNPAYYHCFTDEDFVGRVAKSSSQLHRTTCMLRVLERYLDMLLRRWHGHCDELEVDQSDEEADPKHC